MRLSPEELRLRRRRLLRLMRILFTLQLSFTVGVQSLLARPEPGPTSVALLLTGIGVALLQARPIFRWLGSLNWLYLPLLLILDITHITLLLWLRPLDELARGSLWSLAFVPVLLIIGRWWGYRGATLLVALVLFSNGLVLFSRLSVALALPVFIFQGALFMLSAFITSLAEVRLRREMALREELALREQRVQLANRLHEELSQQVGQIEALLEWAKSASPPGAAQARLSEAELLARNLQEMLERLLRDVRPTPLAVRTLPEALARETEALSRELGIECRFRYAGHLPELRPAAAEYLFRAVQEALRNIQFHAAARTVMVDLDHDQSDVVLRVIDDGVGFDPRQALNNGDHGLLQLQSGAKDLGGLVSIESCPGGGTRMEIRVPVARW